MSIHTHQDNRASSFFETVFHFKPNMPQIKEAKHVTGEICAASECRKKPGVPEYFRHRHRTHRYIGIRMNTRHVA